MKRKALLTLLPALLLVGCTLSDGGSVASSEAALEPASYDSSLFEEDDSAFDSGDSEIISSDEAECTLTLSGSTGTLSSSSFGTSGSEVTITKAGIINVSGSSNGVSITVDLESEGDVYLLFDDVTMANDSMACLFVNSAKNVYLQASGTNSLTSSYASAITVGDASVDGTIHSRDDLIINGEGSLSVVSSSLHGIVAKDDLKIIGCTLDVEAGKKGIDASDSVSILDAEITVKSGTDGIQIENDAGDSYLYMESGSLTIDAAQDGVQVSASEEASECSGYIKVVGGTLDITSGGGSSNAQDESTSEKGLKSDNDIYLSGCEVTISSADDAIHCAGNCSIDSGTYSLSSSDDGIHSDSELYIYGGTLEVTKSYEGLEAYLIEISGGDISLVADDDGINAAGGSDSDTSSDTFSPPGWAGTSSSTGTLYIKGGDLYINCGGDGLDSNGSIYVSGGTSIIEAASTGDNSAIDYGEEGNYVCQITGGTLLGLGSSEMAVNFNSGSQCSALLGVSGSKGNVIAPDDGSSFSYTATKSFSSIVYSSPSMSKGNSYTINVGSSSVTADFTSSYYYSSTSSGHPNQGGTGGGGTGGNPGGGMGGR